MGDQTGGTKLIYRLVWAVAAGALTFVLLRVSGWGLDLLAISAISAGAAIAGALLGPVVLELLGFF